MSALELPRALAPWAEHLEIFPREVVVALGPIVQRLDAAIGPLRIHSRTGQGEPDGIDGLARRGTYERLLLTEWLLADEMPEEFARRAVMGEHNFLHPARREPAGGHLSFALFDAGPSQIGSPRIVQLAALIVLALRAEKARVQFRWGVAQQPQAGFLTACTETSVRRLLGARSAHEVREENLEAWWDRIRSECGAQKVDDLWLIGSRHLAAVRSEIRNPKSEIASVLQIGDLIEPAERRVAAAMSLAGRLDRELVLDLPDDRTCARLLRDPFGAATAEPRRTTIFPASGSGLLFAPNGGKLFARAGSHAIAVYPVPNSPRAPAGKPKMLRSRKRPIVAAGRIGKRTTMASLADDGATLVVECVAGPCQGIDTIAYRLPARVGILGPSPDGPLFQCLPAGRSRGGIYDFLLVANGVLLGAMRHGEHQQLDVLEEHVAAVSITEEGLAYIARRTTLWFLISLGHDGTKRTHRQFQDVGRVFFGSGGTLGHSRYGLVAVEQQKDNWIVMGDEMTLAITPETGERVVGVVGWLQYDSPGLVVVRPDGRTLMVRGRDWTHGLPRAGSRIEHVRVSPAAPHIAYTTVEKELAVYSLAHEAYLLQLFGTDSMAGFSTTSIAYYADPFATEEGP